MVIFGNYNDQSISFDNGIQPGFIFGFDPAVFIILREMHIARVKQLGFDLVAFRYVTDKQISGFFALPTLSSSSE